MLQIGAVAREMRDSRTADQIVGRLGLAWEAMIRVRAGVSFALAVALDKGLLRPG